MAYSRNKISKEEFKRFETKKWEPKIFESDNVPEVLSGIPDEKLFIIVGSGSFDNSNPEADGNITVSDQVGGIDVYRYAEEDDDAKLNKDWYRVLENPNDPETFFLIGPLEENNEEHWIEDIPERLNIATVIKEG